MRIVRKYKIVVSLLLLTTPFWSLSGFANASEQSKTIRIEGRKEAVVTTSQVRLGDIAEVSSQEIDDDEAVIGLEKVIIGDSPLPGKRTTFSAHRIVERLLEEGVSLERVGYVLPRVISVERAARVLTKEEVLSAVQNYVAGQQREIEIRNVKVTESVVIAPGDVSFEVKDQNAPYAGQLDFVVVAVVSGERPVSFKVHADYDEWRQVPVAKHHIGRGQIVDEQDIVMARLNVGELPRDAGLDVEQVVGQQVEGEVAMGDAFRITRLATPAIISAGSRVTLLYKTDLLEASASGVALEAGSKDQEIRVRNSASKKIVVGKAVEPGLVIVGP